MSEKPEPRTTGVGLGLGLLLGGAASGKITDKFPISEDFKHGIVASMASEAGGGGGGLGSIGGGGGGDGGGIGGATRAIGVVREKKWPLAKIALLLSVCTVSLPPHSVGRIDQSQQADNFFHPPVFALSDLRLRSSRPGLVFDDLVQK
jgi:hypothetical protein